MKYDVELDARQLVCPMPLLKLKQALNKMVAGESVHLIVTDKTSLRDFNSYIKMTSHQMEYDTSGDEIHYFIIKG